MVAAAGRSARQSGAVREAECAAATRRLAQLGRPAVESAPRHLIEAAARIVTSGRTAFERAGAPFRRAAPEPIQRFGIEAQITGSGTGAGARLFDHAR